MNCMNGLIWRIPMNERIKELAEKAGFILWGEEIWNPGDAIDWSSGYDAELTKFVELIVREGALWVNDNVGLLEEEAKADLLKHFGIK